MGELNFFEIAMKIEKAGIRFYSKIVESTQDLVYQDLFRDLVQMEKAHYQQFKVLNEKFDLKNSDKIQQALRDYPTDRLFALAEAHEFSLEKSMLELFQFAKKMEEETVQYYTALKKALGTEDSDALDIILREEQGHVRLMNEYIDKLSEN